jgi:hypothetical protein
MRMGEEGAQPGRGRGKVRGGGENHHEVHTKDKKQAKRSIPEKDPPDPPH